MLRRISIAVIVIFAIMLLALNVSADIKRDNNFFKKQGQITKNTLTKLSGVETPIDYMPSSPTNSTQSLGSDAIISLSPGMEIGTTTHDFQHNGRTNRQVEWRGNQAVHFIWFKQDDSLTPGGNGGTGYEMWDPDEGTLTFMGPWGGCDLHPRTGPDNFSGYICLDVDTEGKAVISNHHTEGAGYATTVWYDFSEGACFFAPYKRRLPDSTMAWGVPGTDLPHNGIFVWPVHEYQVFDGDTVTHVLGHQLEGDRDPETSYEHYFRRVGSDTLGAWDYPPVVVDTVPCIAGTITASRTSEKVALVWMSPPGNYPGDPESLARDWLDPGLGVNQRTNDVYRRLSTDMGASWGSNLNVSAYDSTVGGWLGHSDISALLDTDDYLHIVWNAREILPTSESEEGGLGEYAHFWGSRLLHWDEFNNVISAVKDANWDLPDSGCTGGAWNEMSIVKPQISECDGKFYTIFVQFNDIYHGIDNDCADGRYDGTYGWQGTANGELYLSVSDDGGKSWDIARNLTDTYTSHCFSDESEGTPVCEADQYPSMVRYGMEVTTGDFSGAIIVDPGESPYSGSHFLDVTYINDKFPGAVYQDDGVWSTSPYKWFRVPCVEPIPNPILIYSPHEIGQPTWTKPLVQLLDTATLENLGNAPLVINDITPFDISSPPEASAWLTSTPISWDGVNIAVGVEVELELALNAGGIIPTGPRVLEGGLIINSTSMGGSADTIFVELIVADSVQFLTELDIRTDCKRIVFSNHGNIGSSGENGYNLDYTAFEIDCDTTGNEIGDDDHAGVYLYDASPFISRISGTDTLLSSAMFGSSWLDENTFRPLVGPVADSLTFDDYQYGYSGKFVTQDSMLAAEVEYFAPTDPDTCSFIVMKQRIWNNTDVTVDGVIMGDLMDWDIPSDSGSRNQSGYNDAPDKQFMYCIGYDYGVSDTLPNNDCIDDDQRVGGMSYYAGYKRPYYGGSDSIPELVAQWTHMNADWVYPEDHFVPEQLYAKAVSAGGYETWEATDDQTNSDSVAQDLHHVAVFGQYDIAVGDTFVFVKILTTEYDGGLSAIEATVTKARAWIAGHPEIFTWPDHDEPTDCCDVPGDANDNGTVNILDITYLIAYLYKGGPAPPCLNEGDIQANCAINILDITGLISYLYKGGTAPICGCVLP